MRITYSDVCESNDTLDQLRREIPELEYEDKDEKHSGYLHRVNYKGVSLSITVKRHATHAGNQYIEIRSDELPGWIKETKIPMGEEISKEKVLKQLDKMVAKLREEQEGAKKTEEIRERVYAVMATNEHPNQITFGWYYKTVNNEISSYYSATGIDVSKPIEFDKIKEEIQKHADRWHVLDAHRQNLQAKIDLILNENKGA